MLHEGFLRQAQDKFRENPFCPAGQKDCGPSTEPVLSKAEGLRINSKPGQQGHAKIPVNYLYSPKTLRIVSAISPRVA